jgi:hypothetical protein
MKISERDAPIRERDYTKDQIRGEIIECFTRNPEERDYDWDIEMTWLLADAIRIGVKKFSIYIKGEEHICSTDEWFRVFRICAHFSTAKTEPSRDRIPRIVTGPGGSAA